MQFLIKIALAFFVFTFAAQAETKPYLDIGEIKPAVAKALGSKTKDVHLCSFEVYLRDSGKTNLRAAPHSNAKIVGSLPAPEPEYGTTISPRVQVIGGKEGWFLVRAGRWADREKDKMLFEGPAWMAANLADFTIEGGLYTAPVEEAPPVAKLAPLPGTADNWGSDSVKIDKVFGCSGSFVDASVITPDDRKFRGWATGICANQLTTCGGGHRIYEEREGGIYPSAAACREDDDDCPPEKLQEKK
ncbi:MAG: hypothetical protein V4691_02820 [Pseudomonadota bacterium]